MAYMSLCERAGDDEMNVDLLTCGSCRQQFPLTQFLQFVWHKVIGCDDRRRPSTSCRDDVITNRPCDVTRSSQQQPAEDDVSSVTSRAGDIGKFHTLNCRLYDNSNIACFGFDHR